MYCITRIISIRVRPVHIEWFPFSTLQLMSVSRNDKWKYGRTLLGLQVNWLKLCTKKKKLYNKAKKSGLQNDWKVYPVMNNFLKKACNLAQREHINKISEDLKSSGNPKPFRSFVSFVRKDQTNLQHWKWMMWPWRMTWTLREAWILIFQLCLLQKIMEISLSIVISWIPSYQLSFALQIKFLAFWEISSEKSLGPDHLPPIEIALIFCSLLNRSFFAGEVPYAWKIANIVLVHKKGRKDCRENYRQVSLTSIACKVSETIVKDRVVNFSQSLNVFNPNQFGFLEGKSTLTQLLRCFDDWLMMTGLKYPTRIHRWGWKPEWL